jgi:hypothetical protein
MCEVNSGEQEVVHVEIVGAACEFKGQRFMVLNAFDREEDHSADHGARQKEARKATGFGAAHCPSGHSDQERTCEQDEGVRRSQRPVERGLRCGEELGLLAALVWIQREKYPERRQVTE